MLSFCTSFCFSYWKFLPLYFLMCLYIYHKLDSKLSLLQKSKYGSKTLRILSTSTSWSTLSRNLFDLDWSFSRSVVWGHFGMFLPHYPEDVFTPLFGWAHFPAASWGSVHQRQCVVLCSLLISGSAEYRILDWESCSFRIQKVMLFHSFLDF